MSMVIGLYTIVQIFISTVCEFSDGIMKWGELKCLPVTD